LDGDGVVDGVGVPVDDRLVENVAVAVPDGDAPVDGEPVSDRVTGGVAVGVSVPDDDRDGSTDADGVGDVATAGDRVVVGGGDMGTGLRVKAAPTGRHAVYCTTRVWEGGGDE
jgi:hypothetical protein